MTCATTLATISTMICANPGFLVNGNQQQHIVVGGEGDPHQLTHAPPHQNGLQHPTNGTDGDEARLQHSRDNKVIAKPLASRPAPFLHHGLNHPHLHSLLAHCRNPYMGGCGPQVFPLPPGQGFPWAHSTRGKPRRGMMRRAVFSDSQRKGLEKRFQMQKYISKPDRKKLAERLGLKDSQVFYFFNFFLFCTHDVTIWQSFLAYCSIFGIEGIL
uniref:Uncharacterized protein n=1 Tax=Phlebotomus papatasi TaxID=29031 RepID=A0A1B0D8S5_PHLPP